MATMEGATTPEESSVPGQWYASEGGRYVPLEKSGQKTAKQRARQRQAGRKMAAKSIERQHTRIPDGAEKIVLRPRGGLVKLTKYGTAYLTDVIKMSAGINSREGKEGKITPNMKQHSVLVITTSAERKLKYASVKHLMFDGEQVETFAYVATPEHCRKGVIHGVPVGYSIEEILYRLDRKDNPEIRGVRRLGKDSQSIFILFKEKEVPRWIYLNGAPHRCQLYRKKYEVCVACGRLGHRADVCPDPTNVKCRGCGLENPSSDHRCELKCQLCGRGHALGDPKCRELFRTPYEVKKRQWEKMKQATTTGGGHQSRQREPKGGKDFKFREDSFQKLEANQSRPSPPPKGRSRSRARSQSRGRSSSRDPANPWRRGRSKERKGVNFAGKVSQESNQRDKRDEEIEKIKKMVEKLTGIVDSQRSEIQNLKKSQRQATPPQQQPIRQMTPPPPQRHVNSRKERIKWSQRRPSRHQRNAKFKTPTLFRL
ncbi:uncharacterized protein [Dermacentor albipictus]|uniref:uncharacterized protein isoform X1 n=1 Tax=Dermacentor albipictus TaxID=60249 RepID=UPI0038FC067B